MLYIASSSLASNFSGHRWLASALIRKDSSLLQRRVRIECNAINVHMIGPDFTEKNCLRCLFKNSHFQPSPLKLLVQYI